MDPESTPQDDLTPAEPVAEAAVADAATDTPAPEPTTEPEPPAKSRAELLRELLDAADPSELDEAARHGRMAGKIGAVADRLATQRQKESEAAAERERLLQAARDNDLWTVGEHAAKELLEADSSQSEQRRVGQIVDQVHGHVVQWAKATLPADVLTALEGKTYEGKSYEQGLVAYLDDAAAGLVAHRLNAAVEQEVEKRMPAIRARVLAELNGAEPTPELAAGAPAGTSGAQYSTYAQASEALMDGKLSTADLRVLMARNNWR